MKKLIIRADMNVYVATGHMMRCLSVAYAAKKKNIEVFFVSADDDGRKMVEEKGFTYLSLGTDWNKMDMEIPQIRKVISQIEPDYLLVDSYYVTPHYMKNLRKMCKVAYIDDLAKEVYLCDTLICYANYYDKLENLQKYGKDTNLLLGCRYIPLREQFCVQKERTIEDSVGEILVLSGGTDPFHFLKMFLRCIENKENLWEEIHLTVVCGIYNTDYDELKEKYKENRNIEILTTVTQMERYMKDADVAISAGGTSLYELCACGTPTVCYSFADNQLDNVRSFQKDNIMIYAGDLRVDNVVECVVDKVEQLVSDYMQRKVMSDRMRRLVDGMGATRVIEELMKAR